MTSTLASLFSVSTIPSMSGEKDARGSNTCPRPPGHARTLPGDITTCSQGPYLGLVTVILALQKPSSLASRFPKILDQSYERVSRPQTLNPETVSKVFKEQSANTRVIRHVGSISGCGAWSANLIYKPRSLNPVDAFRALGLSSLGL